MPAIDVSILIVSFNTCDLLRECLNSALTEVSTSGLNAEFIVVDNASRDQSAEMVAREFPQVILIQTGENIGFGRANNRGFAIMRGRHAVLLNSDAFMQPGALRRSVDFLDQNPGYGMVGARLVGRDGMDQPSARMFPSLLNDLLSLSGMAGRRPASRFFGRADRTWADPAAACDCDWVPGAYCAIPAYVINKVVGFDERFFLYYEEVDLCRRIIAEGWRVRYEPQIVVIHYGGESSKTVTSLHLSRSGSQLALWRMRSAALYYRKHHGVVAAWTANRAERLWHYLRAWRNASSPNQQRREKAEDSRMVMGILDQAWRDTCHGLQSPRQPWTAKSDF